MITDIPDTSAEDRDLVALTMADLRRPIHTLMKPAISVTSEVQVDKALHLMREKHIGCVLVVDDGRLSGIFTERDVLKRIVGSAFDLRHAPINAVMTALPQALNEDDTIAYALNFMDLGGFRHIPIINEAGAPVGMVSVKDIVSYLVIHFADEVVSLPPHPRVSNGSDGTEL
jgi:CBS domain-containing protein